MRRVIRDTYERRFAKVMRETATYADAEKRMRPLTALFNATVRIVK